MTATHDCEPQARSVRASVRPDRMEETNSGWNLMLRFELV